MAVAANATSCLRASTGPKGGIVPKPAGDGKPGAAVAVVMRASRVRNGSHCCFCNKSPHTRSVFHQSVLRFDKTACLLVLRWCLSCWNSVAVALCSSTSSSLRWSS